MFWPYGDESNKYVIHIQMRTNADKPNFWRFYCEFWSASRQDFDSLKAFCLI